MHVDRRSPTQSARAVRAARRHRRRRVEPSREVRVRRAAQHPRGAGTRARSAPPTSRAGEMLGRRRPCAVDRRPARGCRRPRLRVHARRRQPRPPAGVRGEAAIKAAFVTSAGYGEAGDDGRRGRGASWSRWPRELGMLLAGPERPGRRVDAGVAVRADRGAVPAGGPASRIASQSGQLRVVVPELRRADRHRREPRGVGRATRPRSAIADYLEYFADDDATTVGLAYVEGVADGRAFFERIARRRPRASPSSS